MNDGDDDGLNVLGRERVTDENGKRRDVGLLCFRFWGSKSGEEEPLRKEKIKGGR